MKLVDIAKKIGVPDGTVRRWKSTYHWDEQKSERSDKISERSHDREKVHVGTEDDGTKDTLKNEQLSPEQQMFCIYYSRTFNAAQSYQKAYGCKYTTAVSAGYKLLLNTNVREEIERLKDIKRQQILSGTDDIVEMQMRIAFGDIGNYLSFGKKEIETKDGDTIEVNSVDLLESENVDTQIIAEIKEGREGISVKLKDSQKALEWLTRYFEMNPADIHRREFDKRKLELELAKLELQTKAEEEESAADDNFIEALGSSAKEVWKDD